MLLVIPGCATTLSTRAQHEYHALDMARRALGDTKHPKHVCVTAWGISATSQREAENDARAQIVSQIRSRIEVVSTDVAGSISRDGIVIDSQFVNRSIRIAAKFDRNELIRIDDELSSGFPAGVYRAFAYASRDEIARQLDSEYSDAAVVFRSQAEHSRTLEQDVVAFAQAFHAASSAFSRMLDAACGHLAVTGIPVPGFEADCGLRRTLERSRADLVAGMRIAVSLAADPRIDTRALADAVASAIIGLGVRASTADCVEVGSLRLELQAEIEWNTLAGVRYCKARLSGNLESCPDGVALAPVLLAGGPLEGRGRDPVDNLRRRATAEALKPLVHKALAPFIPFAQSE
ncbi:MAG: hypothetical protein IPK20_00440 [Betaproteobacteria bacterium]|nr:hypothetical protein [Betaproteobacteria bacterium]